MGSVPKSILVVDDSAMIRRLVTMALESAGYRVVLAVDGIDALEKLAACPETALIVCDVRMPRMDGFEFLEAARKGIYAGPVVMLTSECGPTHAARAEPLGARDWLPKPFKRDTLLSTIDRLTS